MEGMKTSGSNAPVGGSRFEFADRVKRLHLIEAAIARSADLYNSVKLSSPVVNRTLSTAESAAFSAVERAGPVLKIMERPAHMVDSAMYKGLTLVEAKLYSSGEEQRSEVQKQDVKPVETKAEIKPLTTKTEVDANVSPTPSKILSATDATMQKVSSLKDLSWKKANELLTSKYGIAAVSVLMHTADVAKQYVEYYFPVSDSQKEAVASRLSTVVQTITTAGQLSNAAVRQLYGALVKTLHSINKENIQDYLQSAIAIMQLVTFLKPTVRPEEMKK